jgi:LacI family transcriptional regulator
LSVPDQLSIIGFDDSPLAARLWPPLTTVHWPTESMARSAALKLIADMIDDDNDVEEPSMFVSTLVTRGSVGPPSS